MTQVFFNDPMALFVRDQVTKIWPRPDMNPHEKINASARFIIFTMSALYLYTRDNRFVIVALVCIAALYIMFNSNTLGVNLPHDCVLPTAENPMGNFLQNELNSDRPKVCDYQEVKPVVDELFTNTFQAGNSRSRSSHPDRQKHAAARQWVMTPSRDNASNQEEFLEFCYGRKDSQTCRGNPAMCSPDARGAQLEAFRGLDLSGDRR